MRLLDLDTEIARRVFEIDVKDVGYYGPPVDPTQSWIHVKSVRYDTPEEAHAAYLAYQHARIEAGESQHGKMDADSFWPEACHWKDGWGPLWLGDYSADIMLAWEVVEKMWERGFHFFDLEQYELDGWPSWVVLIGRSHKLGPVCSAEESTAPLAICRAAIAALTEQPA